MKMISIIIISLVTLVLVGCAGSSEPMLNANSNKIKVFSISDLINITNNHYSGSFNAGAKGSVNQMKD